MRGWLLASTARERAPGQRKLEIVVAVAARTGEHGVGRGAGDGVARPWRPASACSAAGDAPRLVRDAAERQPRRADACRPLRRTIAATETSAKAYDARSRTLR